MAITRDEVRRVAALARLRLEPGEEERLTADLDHILARLTEPGEHYDDVTAVVARLSGA